MRLTHHTIDEWCEVRAAQLRKLECSEEYIEQVIAQLRQRWADR